MNIAVSGASGHVGINLCRALLDQGHRVRALVHSHDAGLKDLPVEIFRGDVLVKSSMLPFLSGIDVVYHLAARITIKGDPDGMVARTNTEGTRNIVAAASASGVGKFIHFSSIHAFRQAPPGQTLDENCPIVDLDGFAYDRSKAEGERSVLAAASRSMEVVVLSPTAILGPEDHEPSLSGKAVIDIYRGKIPSLVPGGYDWVDVRDVVLAAVAAIDKGRNGEKYLLSGRWYSLADFSAAIGHAAGRQTVSTVIPMWVARLGLPFITLYSRLAGTEPLYTSESLTILSEGMRTISHGKAARELDFHPRPLDETISDLLTWFREKQLIH